MRFSYLLMACFLLILICIFLIGCPQEIDTNAIKSGDYYKIALSSSLHSGYGIHFSEEDTPNIHITYELNDGTLKTAAFKLDGYDAEKKIGYKLITVDDKAQWEQQRKNGNTDAPDLNDFELIQTAMIQYEYPVLLLKIYEYQSEVNAKSRSENDNKFFNDLYEKLFKTQRMAKWFEEGLYSGEWIKEGLEETLSESYGLNYSHTDLPTVSIEYDDTKVVFQIDGYDTKRQVGYKFVTGEDIKAWAARREQGDINAPDIAASNQIKDAALYYTFPILFVYVPEYWNTNIAAIFNQKLSDPLNMNEHIKSWLEEHK